MNTDTIAKKLMIGSTYGQSTHPVTQPAAAARRMRELKAESKKKYKAVSDAQRHLGDYSTATLATLMSLYDAGKLV